MMSQNPIQKHLVTMQEMSPDVLGDVADGERRYETFSGIREVNETEMFKRKAWTK